MLPYASDEALLGELRVVVTAGARLPALPDNTERVAHLLLLNAPDGAESYRTRASRLLRLIDDALNAGQLLDDNELTGDEQRGLRILFGLLPDYREASVDTRRADAGDLLVGGWIDRPHMADKAGSFRRRHEVRALGLVLECLKATYGQEERPSEFEVDHLWETRDYWVDDRRQVYRLRFVATIQARVDDLELIYFYQHGSVLEGFQSQLVEGLPTPDGTSTIVEVEETDQVDGPDFITLRLPRPIQTGETLTYGWQQTIAYGEEVVRWKTGFVLFGGRNDDYGFEVSVTFDGERPTDIWWIEDLPYAEHADGPREGQAVALDRAGRASYRREPPTNRAMGYGLAWKW